ncbi:MAG TPA: hypothetical protein VHZ31_02125 [Solirubrobacteraceae bacterium]|nr:hypothetical protein [Solirubrobacteraceae bacterium]
MSGGDRARSQRDAEQVAGRFYDGFRARHASLRAALEGIDDDADARWYASVVMNRLMFVRFLRGKGVADEAIPGIGGAIFEEHEVERRYAIRVPDAELGRILAFFDEFSWSLDDREQRDPNTIDPGVIGYVFERHINVTASGRKEGGAYYTREDVTGYMASVTLLPAVLDRLIAATGVDPFVRLRTSPRRYVHEAMRHGQGPDGRWLAPPGRVGAPHADPLRRLELAEVAREPALQLPDESWVETLDRREHVDRLLALIAAGEVDGVDALITHNLDIRALVADVVHALDSPQDVADAWDEVTAITVVDPTCGSGAFLFAALELLDEIYAALLARARTQLARGAAGARDGLGPLVAAADADPNDGYHRRRHAVLRNLFGLDVMPEAIETAKLRLALSLVARLEDRAELVPLPDLDLNLRCGNLLVGFADVEEARGRAGSTTLVAPAAVDEIVSGTQRVTAARAAFVAAQRAARGAGDPAAAVTAAQHALERVLGEVRDAADRAYAAGAGVEPESVAFGAWRRSHLPFHWMLELPAIAEAGGFDVVIGNPPYIKAASVPYAIDGYATAGLPDLYAPCVERSLGLLHPRGRFAMILPVSFQFSDRHRAARDVVLAQGNVWVSTYSRNPSALFTAGLGVRSSIAVTSPDGAVAHTTATRRWQRAARGALFATTRYSALDAPARDRAWLVRTGDADVATLLQSLRDRDRRLGGSVERRGGFALGFKVTALYYLPVYTRVPPVYDTALEVVAPPKDAKILFAREDDLLLAYALLAGELAVTWWASTGDDFDVTAGTLKSFPVSLAALDPARDRLLELARQLEHEAHQEQHLLFTPYAGLMTGSWDLRRLRPLTREIDRVVLETLGLQAYLPAVIRAVSRLQKSTGERPGTERGMGWLAARRARLGAAGSRESEAGRR